MTTADSDATTVGGRPLLRVVRGDPTVEELAALITVVTARVDAEPEPEPHRSLWSQPILRTALSHGPGAWRASSLPRKHF
jgi:hypothetical protein